MKVLVNLLPISDGGGLQNALSFLSELEKNSSEYDVEIVVRSGGLLADKLVNSPYKIHYVAPGVLARLRFELGVKSLFERGTLCFTLFGPPLLGGVGYLVNVNGCAYSNLFYPEVTFWQDYTGRARLKRELIDIYRRKVTAMADHWIFETSVLSQRAVELCGFPEERVHTVKMAASSLVSEDKVNAAMMADYAEPLKSSFSILFLNGPNRNKRVQNLPSIARELAKLGVDKVKFVTTLPEESELFQALRAEFSDSSIQQYWVNTGYVPQHDVPSLIAACDAMATFSRLESFSNNFVEAWRMKKLLLVTDADWSRASCEGGAIYVNPDNASAVAALIKELKGDEAMRQQVVSQGEQLLSLYPTVAQKNAHYLEVIRKAGKAGGCPSAVKSLIKWPR